MIRSHLKALRRNGIGWNRDRFSWGDVHPERDKIDFNGRNGRYELLRKIAGEEGVKILDTFHDTPQWNKQLLSAKDNFLYGVGGNEYQYGSNIYPRDLCAGAASWSAICRHWPQIAALEVWNEPETNFGNSFPPEFFIAFTKAVSSRFSLDGIQTPVVGGVLANPRAGTDYYRMLIEGGLLNDCDILSFHSYETVEYHENQIVFMRNIERKCAPDRAGIPYWISESGKPWPRGTARALIDDDRYSASEIVGKAIEFRALGVAKYFPFCYFWGEETINNFGMLDNHGAPMRSMAAYGNCALQLAHKDYIGDLLIPGTVRSRVFSDGKESIACLYVPLKMPRRLQLPKGLKVEKITGLDGRNLAMNDREIPLDDGIVYLHFKGEPQKKFLNRNTKAMKCYALAQSYHSTPRSARPVIIQPDYNLTETAYERMGILLAPGRAFEVKLYWNNLSDHQRKVVPQIRLCRGMTSPDFSTKTLMIPANSRVEMRFTLIGDHPLAVDKWSSVVVSDKLGGATPMQMQFTLLPKATAKSGDKVLISDWFSWQGNAKRADIQADFTATYSVNTLNLHIEVRDKSHSCDFSAERAWHGDSVQVALWGGSRYSSEFCIAASREGVKVHRHRPISKYGIAKNVKFHFLRQNGKSVYDLEFPASEFDVKELHAGQELGLSVVVNSSSGNGRNGYLQWGEGITADRKNPNLFNRLVLR